MQDIMLRKQSCIRQTASQLVEIRLQSVLRVVLAMLQGMFCSSGKVSSISQTPHGTGAAGRNRQRRAMFASVSHGVAACKVSKSVHMPDDFAAPSWKSLTMLKNVQARPEPLVTSEAHRQITNNVSAQYPGRLVPICRCTRNEKRRHPKDDACVSAVR